MRIIQSRAVVRVGFAVLIVIWIATFVVEQATFYELNKAQTRVRQLEQARLKGASSAFAKAAIPPARRAVPWLPSPEKI